MHTKNLADKNTYEINGDIAYLELLKKDGSTIKAQIDSTDLTMVLEKGTWFAQWHKDFNNYLVQTLCECLENGEIIFKKQTLQSFLMNLHTKTPIRHINGDTLDNRRCNLELYKQKSSNDYKELDDNTIALILIDKYGKENGKALIDKEDLDKVLTSGYNFVCHKVEGKPYAVANTPEGRIFLNTFIMQIPDVGVIQAINLNTLDCRKSNIKHIPLPEEDVIVNKSKKY